MRNGLVNRVMPMMNYEFQISSNIIETANESRIGNRAISSGAPAEAGIKKALVQFNYWMGCSVIKLYVSWSIRYKPF